MAAVFDYSNLVTTATTSTQTIHTSTISTQTTYKLFTLGVGLTTYSATEANAGNSWIYISTDAGGTYVIKFEQRFQNTDLDNNVGMSVLPLGSGILLSTVYMIRAACTPTVTASNRWNFSAWGETT